MRTLRFPHESTKRSVAAYASVLVFAACSAPPGTELDDEGPPDFSGNFPAAGAAPTAAPAAPAAQAPVATAPAPAPVASAGPTPAAPAPSEQPASNGTPIAPSAPAPNNGNNAGANNGAGGSSMVAPNDGNLGAGGSSMDGAGGAGAPAQQPSPVAEQPPPTPAPPQPATPPPAVPQEPVIDTNCPDGAFFCAGFEQTTFPVGTANIFGGTQFENAFVLDTTEFNSGSQSFFLPLTNQAFSYRVMAIPVPVQAFWARMFVRSDVPFGSSQSHESLFGPSTGNLTQDNNNETRIELSEQFRYMLLNVRDTTPEPAVRRQLSANEWHCLEARYDGDAGEVEIFADGEQFINDSGALFQLDFQTFRLGYMQFNGTARNVWFDDVILSTNRIGCN